MAKTGRDTISADQHLRAYMATDISKTQFLSISIHNFHRIIINFIDFIESTDSTDVDRIGQI